MPHWPPTQLAALCAVALPLIAAPTSRAALEITEFSSNPDESFADADGEFPDWIELTNAGAATASTDGHTLTDDDDRPAKWTLPAVDLAPGAQLVVFASGKDRTDPGAELHTNFSLSSGTGYIALFEPGAGTATTEFDYPKQFYGLSFGVGGYFEAPTPGAPNGAPTYTDFVRDTKFSVDRGFFDAPFSVEITTLTAGAAIYYTTDKTLPSPSNGTLYTDSVQIDTTTVLRAVATKPGHVSSGVDTQTYLFLADVIQQPAALDDAPATWGIDNSTSNGNTGLPRPADYEMDPEVISQFGEAAALNALQHHPTISVVLEPEDLWNESTDSAIGGIYPNPYGGTGNQFLPGWGEPRDWERPCSVEFIGFERTPDKQVDAGVRIAGNFARHPNRYKHHFRLTSRRQYGEPKFKGQFFTRTDVDTFDDFIFRGGNSESWTFPGATGNGPGTRANVQYFRDQFYKDGQAAMGQLAANQEYFHLYLNGLYWGFYTLIERIDAHWLSQHLGGDEEEYDIMKQGNVLQDGSRVAWDAMYSISRGGVANAAGYDAIQDYLDVDNLIDYMIWNFWAGTVDWRNNWRSGRHRVPGAGYMFFNWDGERGLGDRGGNREATFNAATSNRQWSNHPNELHHDLRANPEYRMRFADRVHKHLFNDGVITPTNAAALYNARAEEVRPSLVAESARWGDRQRANNPYTTLNEWADMLDWMNNTFFPQRHDIVLGQLRDTDVYPDTEAPSFNQFGGNVPLGFPVLISNTAGTVYYTTDGSDPRLEGGTINPEASTGSGVVETEKVPRGATWSFNDDDDDLGTAWREPGFDDGAWQSGPAPIGYGGISGTTLATFTRGQPLLTVYYRTSFDIADASLVISAECEAHVDGGAIIYLNGAEIVRDNMPAGAVNHATLSTSDGNEGVFDPFPVPAELLISGTNWIAIEGHNRSPNSSDQVLDFSLTLTEAGTPDVIVNEPTTVRARVLDNGEWSALTEATFATGQPASSDNLVIAEILYNPAGPDESGEFIELLSIGDSPVSLAGVGFDRGITYSFPDTATLAPGERSVITPDDYDGQLANGGEPLRLFAADGSPIRDFRYDDDAPWPTAADGDGRSLVLIDPSTNPDHSLPENWLPSATDGGSPGGSDTSPPPPGVDLAVFFLAGPIDVTLLDGNATIRLPRNLSARGATLTIETSTDLIDWEQSGTYAGFEDGAAMWVVSASDETLFTRVRIALIE